MHQLVLKLDNRNTNYGLSKIANNIFRQAQVMWYPSTGHVTGTFFFSYLCLVLLTSRMTTLFLTAAHTYTVGPSEPVVNTLAPSVSGTLITAFLRSPLSRADREMRRTHSRVRPVEGGGVTQLYHSARNNNLYNYASIKLCILKLQKWHELIFSIAGLELIVRLQKYVIINKDSVS